MTRPAEQQMIEYLAGLVSSSMVKDFAEMMVEAQPFFGKAVIAGLVQPLAQGTHTDALRSIVKFGLGAEGKKPADATRPEKTTLCDVSKPDGFLALYGFATYQDHSSFAVDATKITGRDIVARYPDVNPAFKPRWINFLLRGTAMKYMMQRNLPRGLPMVVGYDGGGTVQCTYPLVHVPSEAHLTQVLTKDMLRFVFVPVSFMNKARQILNDEGAPQVKVYPIEFYEIDELMRFLRKVNGKKTFMEYMRDALLRVFIRVSK